MAHTLRVGCDRREFRVTARGDKPLKSVAKSIAKRLGCSRVSLFANARALHNERNALFYTHITTKRTGME